MLNTVVKSVFLRNACKRNFSSLRRIPFTPNYAILRENSRSIVGTKVELRSQNSPYDVNQTFLQLKILRCIKGAVKEFGPILEKNPDLVSALKKAEELNIPEYFMDYARKVSVDTRAKIGIFELLYLNNGFFIVQYEDVDTSDCKHHLLKICNRYDIHLIHGRVRWDEHFNIKGIISVQNKKLNTFSSEKDFEKIALKTGAQSVKKEIEMGDLASWQFYCEPGELLKIKQSLQEHFEIKEAYVGFIPKRKVYLPAHVKRSTHSIITQIGEHPAIHNVYTNIVL